MSTSVARAVARERFGMALFTAFGAIALLLAGVGLYGVMAFLVNERAREIGIRIALGGRPGHVRWRVLADSLTMTIMGVAIGAAAYLLSGAIADLLFGVRATDVTTYAEICVGLIVVALAATYVPARRASRVDPIEVLRA